MSVSAKRPVRRPGTKPRRANRTPQASRKGSGVLFAIALFKLAKAALLIVVGIGALRLLHRDMAQTVTHWVNILRVDPDNRFIHRILTRTLSISPKQLKEASVGTFVYAGLFLIEGTGLLLRKRWAEYFTIVTTGALIPVEIYELAKHPTLPKTGVLILNAAIVLYLVARVRRVR